MPSDVWVFRDPRIAAYGFGDSHPFGPDRHDAFHAELTASGHAERVRFATAREATRDELMSFHGAEFLDEVARRCLLGHGFLDGGDTPAVRGLDRSAAAVVGAGVLAMDAVMAGSARSAFVPIGGLHHAGRDHAAGFCVYNDCGVVIELLRARHGLRRIAYIDIDAHHGDGVYYAFESDPDLIFADIHEDGRFLYPGTGAASETGRGPARGSKLNLPLAPGAGDREFFAAFDRIEAWIESRRPEFILLQCGADSIAGDPITHLEFTPAAHAYAAARLSVLADRHAGGRLVAFGGGGYNRRNLARGWTAVVAALVEHPSSAN